jgi:uncharacterized protein YjbI with pentapeptide repeats
MRTCLSIALIFFFTSFSAQETLTYPYNPDGDVDGTIASPDLLDILGVYGNAFTPTEIEIDGVNLLQVIQDLQNQIASIPIIDVNYVEATLAAMQGEIEALQEESVVLKEEITFLSAHQDFQDIEIVKMKYVSDSLSVYNDYLFGRIGEYFMSPFCEQLNHVGGPIFANQLNAAMASINDQLGDLTFGMGGVDWAHIPVTFGPDGVDFYPLGHLGNTLIADLSVNGGVGAALAGTSTFQGALLSSPGGIDLFLSSASLTGVSNITASSFEMVEGPDGNSEYYLGNEQYTDFGPSWNSSKQYFNWPREVKGQNIVADMQVEQLDLSGANLVGADIRNLNRNLGDVDIQNVFADFSGAFLMYADLENSLLVGADFSNADLSNANLKDADLTGADLSGANLSGTNLSGAGLDLVTWTGVKFFNCGCPCTDADNDGYCD